MKTQIDRTFHQAFLLNEKDLRRIYDLMYQQMERIITHDDVESSFNVKYKNEIVEEFSSIGDIVEVNNGGAWTITSIEIVLSPKRGRNPQIRLQIGRQRYYSSVNYKI